MVLNNIREKNKKKLIDFGRSSKDIKKNIKVKNRKNYKSDYSRSIKIQIDSSIKKNNNIQGVKSIYELQ